MQRYKILHRTYYNYTNEVLLGPHELRLRPREDYELRIESSNLKITPTASLLWHRDVENNSVAIASFDKPTSQLLIESEVIIQQFNESPYDFLVTNYAVDYPFQYESEDQLLLSPYMTLPEPYLQDLLADWIALFWQQSEPIQTYILLQRMASYIYTNQNYSVREAPGVQSASETLSIGSGSCRDFAWLFMQAARCLGLAARFVSGYLQVLPTPIDNGATHAWAEVYLPGAGWKGFDPTLGKMAGSDHIAVAVARSPEAVPPVSGSFSGVATSTLDVGVWVNKC
jgi:transglutaminase-like putative cysteine protease